MSFLAPIAMPAPLTARAAEALRRDILSIRLAPGETLSEAMTASRLGLGKAPVRAALARLAEEGLVQAVPRRGWVVSLVTIRDIHEVFDLRLLLEPEAARRAALNPLARADAAALTRLDAVCAAGYRPEAGETALSLLVLGLRRRDRSGEMAHEHRALIAALAAGDAEAGAATMRAQVEASRSMVLAALTAPDTALPVS
jgi:DNA-binding GntR family transcriptional regulator